MQTKRAASAAACGLGGFAARGLGISTRLKKIAGGGGGGGGGCGNFVDFGESRGRGLTGRNQAVQDGSTLATLRWWDQISAVTVLVTREGPKREREGGNREIEKGVSQLVRVECEGYDERRKHHKGCG